MERIKVLAPATVSNVVCGFDCLGFSLEMPYDELVLSKITEPLIHITHLDEYDLPTDPDNNLAGIALRAFINAAGLEYGFEGEIKKAIKPGSGIGSSAASACGV